MTNPEETRSGDFKTFLESLSSQTTSHLKQTQPRQDLSKPDDHELPPPQWHLVLVPFEQLPEIEHYDSLEDLCKRIAECLNNEIHCFPIYGWIGQICPGVYPHFLHPDGRAYRLYDPTISLTPSEDFYVGRPDTRFLFEEEPSSESSSSSSRRRTQSADEEAEIDEPEGDPSSEEGEPEPDDELDVIPTHWTAVDENESDDPDEELGYEEDDDQGDVPDEEPS